MVDGLSMSDIFITTWSNGCEVKPWNGINNAKRFGNSFRHMWSNPAIAGYDWDIDRFMEKYGDFNNFGGSAHVTVSSTTDTCELAIVLCVKNGDDLEEMERINLLSRAWGERRTQFYVENIGDKNIDVVRFEIRGWQDDMYPCPCPCLELTGIFFED